MQLKNKRPLSASSFLSTNYTRSLIRDLPTFQKLRPVHNKESLEQLRTKESALKRQIALKQQKLRIVQDEMQQANSQNEQMTEKLAHLNKFLSNKIQNKLGKSTLLSNNLKRQEIETEEHILRLEQYIANMKNNNRLNFKFQKDIVKARLVSQKQKILPKIKSLEKEVLFFYNRLDFCIKEENQYEEIELSLANEGQARMNFKIKQADNHRLLQLQSINSIIEIKIEKEREKLQELKQNIQVSRKLITLRKQELNNLLQKRKLFENDDRLLRNHQNDFRVLTQTEKVQTKNLLQAQDRLNSVIGRKEKLQQNLTERKQKQLKTKEALKDQLQKWNVKLDDLNEKYKNLLIQPQQQNYLPSNSQKSSSRAKLFSNQVSIRKDQIRSVVQTIKSKLNTLGNKEQIIKMLSEPPLTFESLQQRLKGKPLQLVEQGQVKMLVQYLVEDLIQEEELQNELDWRFVRSILRRLLSEI